MVLLTFNYKRKIEKSGEKKVENEETKNNLLDGQVSE
ncbi:MAG: hypothetical protein ACI8ZB_001347 [Desulforhopalus sp.]|jgi:hypothetical protein